MELCFCKAPHGVPSPCPEVLQPLGTGFHADRELRPPLKPQPGVAGRGRQQRPPGAGGAPGGRPLSVVLPAAGGAAPPGGGAARRRPRPGCISPALCPLREPQGRRGARWLGRRGAASAASSSCCCCWPRPRCRALRVSAGRGPGVERSGPGRGRPLRPGATRGPRFFPCTAPGRRGVTALRVPRLLGRAVGPAGQRGLCRGKPGAWG